MLRGDKRKGIVYLILIFIIILLGLIAVTQKYYNTPTGEVTEEEPALTTEEVSEVAETGTNETVTKEETSQIIADIPITYDTGPSRDTEEKTTPITYEKPTLAYVIAEKGADYVREEVINSIEQKGRERVIIKLDNPDKKEQVKKYLDNVIKESDKFVAAYVTEQELMDFVNDINAGDIDVLGIDHRYKIELDEVVPLIRADLVWDSGFTGKGQSVCVVDTGIDYNHTNLSNNYVGGYDFVNNDNDPIDDHGHGTYVSGITTGIAPDTNIFAVKVFSDNGESYESDILLGIDYCIENKDNYNISVILMAFGGGVYNTTCFCDENLVAVEANYAVNQGIFAVAASGNDGEDYLKAPSCGSNVTSVGGTDDNDNLASFTHINRLLDLLAPGVDVTSTALEGGTRTSSGSSASAAVVAGVATLILEKETLSPLNLNYRLRSTGILIEHEETDYPRIDAYNALINNKTNEPIEQIAEVCEEGELEYGLLVDCCVDFCEGWIPVIECVNMNNCHFDCFAECEQDGDCTSQCGGNGYQPGTSCNSGCTQCDCNWGTDCRNVCNGGCAEWLSCSGGSCSSSSDCGDYTCSAGDCTSTCSETCGATCDTHADCTSTCSGNQPGTSCNLGGNCECNWGTDCTTTCSGTQRGIGCSAGSCTWDECTDECSGTQRGTGCSAGSCTWSQCTNECNGGCAEWLSCSGGSCSSSSDCGDYTCSAGDCTSTCSETCGATCDTHADCTSTCSGNQPGTSCNLGGNCECNWGTDCTNVCNGGCAEWTDCSGGSCSSSSDCGDYTCSAGDCTSTCSETCGATCDSNPDCTSQCSGDSRGTSCNLGTTCDCNWDDCTDECNGNQPGTGCTGGACDWGTDCTNVCNGGCAEWLSCSGGSCSSSSDCGDYTCSAGDCTSTCSETCGAECDAHADCGAGSCDLGGTCDCTRVTDCTTYNCLFIQDSSTNDVAIFDADGNLDIEGGLSSGGDCSGAPANSFIIQNSGSAIVAYIDDTGDMCIEGSLSENQGSCATAGFIVQNSTGTTRASISSTGNLCLTGEFNDYATAI